MNTTENSVSSRQNDPGFYLTSELTQRLDLIGHLLANTELIPFIQSAEGCGKTRLARHLADTLSDRYTVSLISGGPMSDINDLRAALAEIAGIPSDSEISDDLLEEQFCQLAENNKNLLLLLDDADQLAVNSLSWIIRFFSQQKNACNTKCVIFSAVDVLALPLDPVQLSRLKDTIQVLDIPRFNAQQTSGFVEYISGDKYEPLTDAQIAALQKQTHGVPGKILWQVQFADVQQADNGLQEKKAEPWLKPLVMVAIVAFLVTVSLIIYFQEEINQFIASSETEQSPAGTELQTLVIPAQEALPMVVTDAPENLPLTTEEEEVSEQEDLPQQVIQEEITEQQPIEDPEIEQAVQLPEQATVAEQPSSPIDSQEVESEPEPTAETQPVEDEPVEAVEAAGEKTVAEGTETEPEATQPVKTVKTISTKTVEKVLVAPVPPEPPVPAAAPEAEVHEGYRSLDWLFSHDDQAYTLQLLAVSDRSGIDRFVTLHNLQGDMVIMKSLKDNKSLYALLYGAFASRDAAVAAKKQLPKSLKSSSAWPRSVISLKKTQPAN